MTTPARIAIELIGGPHDGAWVGFETTPEQFATAREIEAGEDTYIIEKPTTPEHHHRALWSGKK